MPAISCLFAYVGPETFLPVTSVLAAVLGVVLMLWRSGIRVVLSVWTSRVRPQRTQRMPKPHFQTQPQPQERVEAGEEAAGL